MLNLASLALISIEAKEEGQSRTAAGLEQCISVQHIYSWASVHGQALSSPLEWSSQAGLGSSFPSLRPGKWSGMVGAGGGVELPSHQGAPGLQGLSSGSVSAGRFDPCRPVNSDAEGRDF